MPTCPNGHQSGSEDWCEVCGHRMTGAGTPGAVPPPPPPPPAPGYGYPQGPGPGGQPTAGVELCPQCRTPREPGGPFCEECRWNFLTNTATSYTPLAPQPGAGGGPVPGLNLPPGFQAQPGPRQAPPAPHAPGPQPPQPRDPFEYQSSRPSQLNRPAEPLVPDRDGRQAPPSAFQQNQQTQQNQQNQQPPAFPQAQQGRPGPQEQQSPFPQGGQPQFPGHPGQPSFPQSQPGQPGPQQGPPAAFQQGPPAGYQQGPPQAFQQSAPPAPGPSSPTEADDWMLPPPSQAQGRTQAPHAPAHQQPPHPFQQQNPAQQSPQQVAFSPPFPGQGGFPGAQTGPGAQGGPPGGQEPQRAATWTAVIAPDRDYFLAMMQRSGPEATGLNLPAYSPEQHLELAGSQITIGRRRHSTGESPDIDLAVPPEDPGVSHQHAILVKQPDGGWAVVDQNSTNGTTLNGAEDPIQPYVPVPLQDGDQVHVGAWTTITVRRG
ncbi:FHA domain-containing protein [Streptomyces sp. NPDC002690]